MPDLTRTPNRLRRAMPYMLIAPVLVYYLLFWAQPVLTAVLRSLTDADGAWTLRYYRAVFRDPEFLRAARNTTAIVAISVTLEFVVAFALALLINRRFKGAGMFLFLCMIPMALPPVAVGVMWSTGLATYGWLNSLLTHLGLLSEGGRIPFLAGGDFRAAMVIILVDAWQVIPFMMIILLAGMQNLEREMTEAGYVFGGGPWTVFRRITVPLLKPTIQTALLLRIISAIQIWLIVVMLYGFRRVPVLLEEVVFYQEQLSGPDHHRIALAYAVLVAVVVSTVAILYLRVSGRSTPEEAGA